LEKRSRSRELPDWLDNTTSRINWQQYLFSPPGAGSPFSSRNDTWNLNRGTAPRGQQITVDEIHPLFTEHESGKDVAYNPEQRFIGDLGGPFQSTRWGVFSDSYPQSISLIKTMGDTKGESYYTGPIWAINPLTVGIPSPSGSDLNTLGATAIARCKPTNPVANVGTALGELFREGLPSLAGVQSWKERANAAKGSAGEFLNYQFGWVPLANDVRNVAYAAANADSILSQYERNAGKIVRRRYEFPVEETETTTFISQTSGALPSFDSVWLHDPSVPVPKLYATTRTYRKVWFSGAFTYYLPTGYGSRIGLIDAAAKAGPLLGLELTPDVVWNLTPWSWAIDWFSNAGDVISNLSDWATDGLVLRWGYIMEHVVQSVTYALDGKSDFGKGGSYSSPVTAFYELKRREKANPFGFGLDWNGLSPRQLAISVALGITRAF